MTDTIHIVAGNYEEFRQYRNKKHQEWKSTVKMGGSDFPRYTFVQHSGQFRGLSDIKGFYIGTYDKRDDIDEIRQEINIIKSKHKYTIGIHGNATIGTYTVNLNGVLVDPNDYIISETIGILSGKKTTYVTLSFTQAPPAGSHLIITNKDGIVISRTVSAGFTTFTYEFPEITP